MCISPARVSALLEAAPGTRGELGTSCLTAMPRAWLPGGHPAPWGLGSAGAWGLTAAPLLAAPPCAPNVVRPCKGTSFPLCSLSGLWPCLSSLLFSPSFNKPGTWRIFPLNTQPRILATLILCLNWRTGKNVSCYLPWAHVYRRLQWQEVLPQRCTHNSSCARGG